ncbi:MAG: hypothetical protein C6I00_00285 [Nitratiruptor sp.]|nr:hypothetical protein [Nitratiruptor sp.]NPA83682.1 EAL domain-containing protein [Campylobacterota bacterium]
MERDFNKELLDLVYKNLKVSLLGLFVSTIVLYLVYERYVPSPTLLLVWFIAMLLVTGARFLDLLLYQRQRGIQEPKRWERRFFILLILSTLLWSFAALFALWVDDLAPLALLAAIYVGVTVGGALSLAPYLKAALTFLSLPLLIYTGVLITKGETYAYELALLLLFFYIFMVAMAKRLHRQFLQLLVTKQKYLIEKNMAHQTQERLKAVFEHSPVGIFFYDEDYRLIDANRSFFEMTQLDPQTKQLPATLADHLGCKESQERYIELNERHLKLLSSPIIQGKRLLGAVGIVSDITKERKLLQQTEYQARYDHLTKIPNRSSLFEYLHQALQRIATQQESFAVLFVDLDDFKNINDSLGHHVGDQILVEISNRLKRAIRRSDFIARLGGDEFVVVLDHLDPNRSTTAKIVHKIAQKLHEEICKPIHIAPLTLRLTSSIGVVLVEEASTDPYEIVKFADIAMYQAKRMGKNNTQFFQKEMDQWIKRRLEIESALRNAVKNGELTLHYQPIVSLQEDRTIALEALLRWNNHRFKDVGVEEMIQIAEECGAILEIGAWGINRALEDFRRLRESFDLERIAINISIRQFNEPDFIATITKLAKLHDIPFEAIELEITESIFINNKEQAREIMRELRKLGFQLAIDDFGTGYSSLSYLKYLPFTTLKIDRTFIRGLPDDRDDAALVHTIVSIAKGFNLELVAEGVEEPSQLAFLRRLGCHLYQGYIKSKPLQYEQIHHLLAQERQCRSTATS